jgi:hypothetical protein
VKYPASVSLHLILWVLLRLAEARQQPISQTTWLKITLIAAPVTL